jgi:acyl-coenzyme A synthetase/AMP-(fatty) acid ligase
MKETIFTKLLLENLKNNPDQTAIIDTLNDTSLTFGELGRLTAAWQDRLVKLGIGEKCPVVLEIEDQPDWIAIFFALTSLRAVCVISNTRNTQEIKDYIVEHSKAAFTIREESFDTKEIIITETRFGSDQTYNKYFMGYPEVSELMPDNSEPDDVCFIMYTSGSTGKPKGVVHRNYSLLYSVACISESFSITKNEFTLSVPKLSYAYGLLVNLGLPFVHGGGCILISEPFNAEQVLRCIGAYKPKAFFAIPLVYAKFLEFDHTYVTETVRDLTYCVCAGSPLSKTIYNKWLDATGHHIYDCVGSTETMTIYLIADKVAKTKDSIGKVVPHVSYDLASIDEDNELFELILQTPSLMLEYLNNPEATNEKIDQQGRFITGDTYRIDEDGHLYFEGRKDDLFKINGRWVNPLEIEEIMRTTEGISECVVLYKTGEDGVNYIKAFVKIAETVNAHNEVIEQSLTVVREKLPSFKHPREVHLIDEVPRTVTGKINRKELAKI